jgi:16S rRNA (adenine1518-N6/adenine1519-N6)-dimethyltransferase
MTPPEKSAKSQLRRLDVFPRKKLGQNFMTSGRDLAFIAGALSIHPKDAVVEIGPGLGALTETLLAAGASVTAVEKDRTLTESLKQRFGEGHSSAGFFTVVCKDILRINLAADLHLKPPVKVIGNIPYNITSPIVEWLISQRAYIEQAVLTVQWEVARRLTAKPGNKDWGSLSFFLQYYADVELLRKIDKSHFYPPPKVNSGVVHIRFLGQGRFPVSSEENLFRCVRKAFQKRRKTLLNALLSQEPGTPSKEALAGLLLKLSIDPRRRAETLSIFEWTKLSESLGSFS